MEFVYAAISLGLLGSFHCIGMCGPIALALPVNQYSIAKKYSGILLYNIGRALTYSILGVLFGLLGQSFNFGGFQRVLSISLGSLILFFVIISYTPVRFNLSLNIFNAYINKLKSKLGRLFNKKGLQFIFLIGLLNGLLPCGFVYLALAGAISTGSYFNGALFMLFFGLATAPIMVSVSIFGQYVSIRFRSSINKSLPILTSLMAIFLILRGLNLGIPMLSPEYNKKVVAENSCNKKQVIIKCCVPQKK